MHQSNALRKLETTLNEAMENGNKNTLSGVIILNAMKLSENSRNIVIFYQLMSKAKEEAISLKNISKIERYIKVLDDLQEFFVVNHLWSSKWNDFAIYLESKYVLNSLDALANYFHQQNPAIFLESEFLEKLKSEFQSLSTQISSSDLSKDLISLLIKGIDDILQAIQRYDVDGTQELEKATKSFVTDLVRVENSLNDEDRKNPKYKKVKSWILSFLIWITPTPYDIIGTFPDVENFWVPKFEDLVIYFQEIESLCETSSIQEVLESSKCSRQPQKSLPERKTKYLPPSKED